MVSDIVTFQLFISLMGKNKDCGLRRSYSCLSQLGLDKSYEIPLSSLKVRAYTEQARAEYEREAEVVAKLPNSESSTILHEGEYIAQLATMDDKGARVSGGKNRQLNGLRAGSNKQFRACISGSRSSCS